MKKITAFLALLLTCFSANGSDLSKPKETTYCSKHGSNLKVKMMPNGEAELVLNKNGSIFTLVAPIATIELGGQRDIQDIQSLIASTGWGDSVVARTRGFSIPTHLSDKSSIKAHNNLMQVELTSGSTMGVLSSNGTLVFVGSEMDCAADTSKPVHNP